MIDLSVITIVRNRPRHLQRLIEGLAASDELPLEVVVVDMSDEPVVLPQLPFPSRRIDFHRDHLALADARNEGARATTGEHLLFLDVDCIPQRNLVATMDRMLTEYDALICPEVRYLGPDGAELNGDGELMRASVRHPVRNFPDTGVRIEHNAGLFWSLAFGIRRERFDELHGFDAGYDGYGAEDTDFGFRAREAGLPLLFMGGTGAFHQHHGVISPPLQHLTDIVRNAERFHNRWGIWPMDGWLAQFAAMKLIAFDGRMLKLLRQPTVAEIQAATQPPSVYF